MINTNGFLLFCFLNLVWLDRGEFYLQIFVDILWDNIWLLCNGTKDWRRRVWWSCSPSPRGTFCFYNSVSGRQHLFAILLPPRSSLFNLILKVNILNRNALVWFSAGLDSSIQLGALLTCLVQLPCCFQAH